MLRFALWERCLCVWSVLVTALFPFSSSVALFLRSKVASSHNPREELLLELYPTSKVLSFMLYTMCEHLMKPHLRPNLAYIWSCQTLTKQGEYPTIKEAESPKCSTVTRPSGNHALLWRGWELWRKLCWLKSDWGRTESKFSIAAPTEAVVMTGSSFGFRKRSTVNVHQSNKRMEETVVDNLPNCISASANGVHSSTVAIV